MRQLLTRLDDDLHAHLRERAAAEGRSVNALVSEVLALAVADPDDLRKALRRRVARAGLLAQAPRPAAPRGRDEAIAVTQGAGDTLGRALDRGG